MASQAAEQRRAGRPGRCPPGFGRMALYVLLGFSAGLPFYMFSTVLALRLQAHEVGLVVIGFFAWVQLLPTFKFLWAPLLDRYDVPGFAPLLGQEARLDHAVAARHLQLDGGDGADLVGRQPGGHRLVRGAARLLDDDARSRRRRLADRARADPGRAGPARRRQSVGLSHRDGRGGQRRAARRRSSRAARAAASSGRRAGHRLSADRRRRLPAASRSSRCMRPDPGRRRQPRRRARCTGLGASASILAAATARRPRRSAGCC